MVKQTPLHVILAEEAKGRSYRRCGVGWVKDYGDVVAEIRLESKSVKGWYACHICLYVKLDHVPDEYLELLEDFTPNMIHIYIPPAKSPDKTSHLLKVVNQTMIGPSFENDEISHEDKRIRLEIGNAFKLDRAGNLDSQTAADARRYLAEWGFLPLDLCKSRSDLAKLCRQGQPPFGAFMDYADKYF